MAAIAYPVESNASASEFSRGLLEMFNEDVSAVIHASLMT